MKIFAIDTSSSAIGYGLYLDGKKITKISTPNPKCHNKVMLAEIDTLLNENGLVLGDFDAYGVVVGPGSFTGIRIGVATVNAFAMANKKPVIEIVSLEQLDDGQSQVILLDCKHNNYYAGFFRENGSETVEYRAINGSELDKTSLSRTILEGVLPEKMLDKTVEKYNKGMFVTSAKPFYLKKSSAETGE